MRFVCSLFGSVSFCQFCFSISSEFFGSFCTKGKQDIDYGVSRTEASVQKGCVCVLCVIVYFVASVK